MADIKAMITFEAATQLFQDFINDKRISLDIRKEYAEKFLVNASLERLEKEFNK